MTSRPLPLRVGGLPHPRRWILGIGLPVLLLAGCTGTGAPPPPEPQAQPADVRMAKGPPMGENRTNAPLPPPKPGRPDPPAMDFHTVRPGDTLWGIAASHNVEFEQLATWNRITQPDQIRVGQKLRLPPPRTLPGAVLPGPAAPVAARPDPRPDPIPGPAAPAAARPDPRPDPKPEPRPEEPPPTFSIPTPAQALREMPPQPQPTPGRPDNSPEPTGARSVKPLSAEAPRQWLWPHRGRIISWFGQHGAQMNTGIDIAVNPGDPVVATADGVVAYANQGLSSYGNMILLRHGGSFMTAYAHVQKILVKQGQTVRAGETIALAGQSGITLTPRLHFEIRRSIAPQNPLSYLPKRE
ncbi:MAG: M23 family metallopeptidase [Magnetococcales bacterium]|nr:M23 family metallopeptidase [Magnetococcales bacterium]